MIEMNEERRLGSVGVSLPERLEVGSYQDFVLTYTAGFFGIDDSGSIKICYRYATDMGVPQFDDPKAAHYVRVTTDADATLVPRFDTKDNTRPWGKTIYIKVTNGYLVEGNRIEVHFGDRSEGSPGIRMQTFCEKSFEFRALVDVFACYRYERVPSPARSSGGLRKNEVELVAGEPVRYRGHGPSTVSVGEEFFLRMRAEDVWGNPTAFGAEGVSFEQLEGIAGLPADLKTIAEEPNVVVGPLRCTEPALYRPEARTDGGHLIEWVPIECLASPSRFRYWADLHGQSEETIGTNNVSDYFSFARDVAWLDVAAHQGNDFQVTSQFWRTLQETTARFYEPGRFVTFPGYEWSANTGLGGDHNVYFLDEGETIHRSCHALIDDTSDIDTDCNRIDELFEALSGRDAMVFAHVGGRYAVLPVHDPEIQRSVEIHSAWGTFEWLLADAFELGHRVGVVCNSDGHKGRPGASYPGASLFGSYGGLTCVLAPELTRDAIWEAYRRRHHYGTTGARMILSVTATLDQEGRLLTAGGTPEPDCDASTGCSMGDIVATDASSATVMVTAHGTAPVERVELRNAKSVLETIHPYSARELGRRIRLLWQGAAFRGRGRQIDWNGGLEFSGNRAVGVEPINFYNPDRSVQVAERGSDGSSLSWQSFTTGGIAGVIITLENPTEGELRFSAGPISFETPISDIGSADSPLDDLVYPAEGIDVRVTASRLPDRNPYTGVAFQRTVPLKRNGDDAIYVCVIQEDGHMAWSSPMYLVNK